MPLAAVLVPPVVVAQWCTPVGGVVPAVEHIVAGPRCTRTQAASVIVVEVAQHSQVAAAPSADHTD